MNTFTLNFREVKDLSEAMLVAKNCIDYISEECVELVIERNKFAIPSNQFKKTEKVDVSEWAFWHFMDLNWLNQRFIFDFVYWKDYKMMALAYDLPKYKNFFTFQFEFQYTGDMNYDYNIWLKSGLKFFIDRTNKIKNMPYFELYKLMLKEDMIEEGYPISSDDKKEYLYHLINEDLDITGLSYYGEGNFELFSLCAITSEAQLHKIYKNIMQKYIN